MGEFLKIEKGLFSLFFYSARGFFNEFCSDDPRSLALIEEPGVRASDINFF